ncbi:MAG: hypothetical protein EBU90_31460, partial [Proteobacteria bacterium]|nr:hypothetical protein [Pseudomonadota bacterium]NBP16986.1 hypothetical protein [bacterium]
SFFTYYETGSSFDTDKGPDGFATNVGVGDLSSADENASFFTYYETGSSVATDLGNFNSVNSIGEDGLVSNSQDLNVEYTITFTPFKLTKAETVNEVNSIISEYQNAILEVLGKTTNADFDNGEFGNLHGSRWLDFEDRILYDSQGRRTIDYFGRNYLHQQYNVLEVTRTLINDYNAIYSKESSNSLVWFSRRDVSNTFEEFITGVGLNDAQFSERIDNIMKAIGDSESRLLVPGGR